MANHSEVYADRRISKEEISRILEEVSRKRLMGNLKIEYSDQSTNPNAWGVHVWMHKYVSPVNGESYGETLCWLNDDGTFELRHGGGDFMHWVADIILNEIAIAVEGTIYSEGTGEHKRGRRVSSPPSMRTTIERARVETPPEFLSRKQ